MNFSKSAHKHHLSSPGRTRNTFGTRAPYPYTRDMDVTKVFFPAGIPGFPGYQNYILQRFADDAYDPLVILTREGCLDLPLILLPIDEGTARWDTGHKFDSLLLALKKLCEQDSLEQATQKTTHVPAPHVPEDLASMNVYAIVRIEHQSGQLLLQINLKAPVLIIPSESTEKPFIGRQVVLNSEPLPFRHALPHLSQFLAEQVARKKNREKASCGN